MARTVPVPSWAALASWGRGRAAAIVSNPGRHVRFWTRGPVGAHSPSGRLLWADLWAVVCGHEGNPTNAGVLWPSMADATSAKLTFAGFRGRSGARCSPSRDETQEADVRWLRSAAALPCHAVWGGHAVPTGPAADGHPAPSRAPFWRVIHRQKLSTAQSSISLRFIDSGTRTPSPGLHFFGQM